MDITLHIDKQTQQSLQYAVTELDIATCQEGQCIIEPAHWTPEEVISIILHNYLKDFRTLVTLRPLPAIIWPYILPRTGRTEPPPPIFAPCAAVEALRQGGRSKRVAGRR